MNDNSQSRNGGNKIAVMPVQSVDTEIDLDPIALVDEPTTEEAAAPSKIRAFGSSIGDTSTKTNYKRQVNNVPGCGACRIRSFHGRLSDEGLAFMDNKINAWLDEHPEIEVKQVTSTVGLYDGKIKEPALILNVWY
jgi:hypothetical protein